jgi:hypothetical protein
MVFRKISLVFIALFAWGNSAHAALTCHLNQSFTYTTGANTGNNGSAVGTFTLDKIGTLATSNFTAWSILITTNDVVSPIINTFTLTETNSSIIFADPSGAYNSSDPVMVSTANSLTITPTTFTLADYNPAFDLSSNFLVQKSANQYYGLFHYGPSDPSGSGNPSLTAYRPKEHFRLGNTAGSDFIENAGTIPSTLNLTCTCVTGGGVTCPASAVSAPIDLISDKKSQNFSKEISIQ